MSRYKDISKKIDKFKKSRTVAGTVAKVIIAIILVLNIFFLVNFTIPYVAEGGADAGNSKAEIIDICERSFTRGEYDNLYEELTLYNEYNDADFEVYWEITDAYNTYIEYIEWRNAELAGEAGAADNAITRLNSLKNMADNPKYSRNSAALKKFYNKAMDKATEASR